MIIILKIILAILIAASFFLFKFTHKEYKFWLKSPETDMASVYEKLYINVMVFIVFAVIIFISISSLLLMFSKITVQLPF